MITKKEVTDLVKLYQKKYSFMDYKLKVSFKDLERDDLAGDIEVNSTYKEAIIRINARIIKTKKLLIETVKHEMLHILHAEYDYLLEKILSYNNDEDFRTAHWNISRFFTERLVTHIERLIK